MIPPTQMKRSAAMDALSRAMPDDLFGGMGFGSRTVPNAMEEIAMKCNRCGEWVCNSCAVNSALSAGAGGIKHSNCGGMFENP
jgi:hypothetical protein